jgi:hypothetical protein
MTPQGSAFIVNENAGVTVGVYNTELEAQQRMEDCERDDLMLETARSLVEKAVDAFIFMHRMEAGRRTIGLEKRRTRTLARRGAA